MRSGISFQSVFLQLSVYFLRASSYFIERNKGQLGIAFLYDLFVIKPPDITPLITKINN